MMTQTAQLLNFLVVAAAIVAMGTPVANGQWQITTGTVDIEHLVTRTALLGLLGYGVVCVCANH